MKPARLAWLAIVVLCIVAALQERPNAGLLWRYWCGAGRDAQDDPLRAVPEKLIKDDLEAGALLRYRVAYDYEDPQPNRLRRLIIRYPQNEFCLARLAEDLIEADDVELSETLETVDRLLAVNPDNAHYRYLRGWAILEARTEPESFDEAMAEFEAGHALPEFYLPYSKYKTRVDRLAGKAVLDRDDRGYTFPFYGDLGPFIARDVERGNQLGLESWRRLADAAVVMATRLIDRAYDFESLSPAISLLQTTERARLERLERTTEEAARARYHVARAETLDEWRMDWRPGNVSNDLISTSVLPAAPLVLLIVICITCPMLYRHREGESGKGATPTRACLLQFALLAFLLILLWLQQSDQTRRVASCFLLQASFIWIIFAMVLSSAVIDNSTESRLWLAGAYAMFWLNGVVFLVVGSGHLASSAHDPAWRPLVPFVCFWSLLCQLLFWAATLDRRPLLGRLPHGVALLAVMGFAIFLMTLEISGAHWRRINRAHADPFSHYRPLSGTAQTTYEQFIRDGGRTNR